MNTDIEDFISTKNCLGSDDYNNFNPDDWDIPTCKNLFITLLNWIQNKRDSINIGNNNILNKENSSSTKEISAIFFLGLKYIL